MNPLYIGLMSGTSLDGVDGVLAEVPATGPLTVLAHAGEAFEPGLRNELLQLNTSGPDEIHRAALAANRLAEAYARVVGALLGTTGTRREAVRAIGAHGQTVRHQPGAFDGRGYTTQINQPALLAELTGITVVADFRSRDVAAGGQGAPLVPAFHRAAFARAGLDRAVLNLGGIANLTLLPADGEVRGFDCGPANVLMDLWTQRHLGQSHDDQGHWAASGRVHEPLLASLMGEPWLRSDPPKSTGRDLLHADWLAAHLARCPALAPADVQATLCEFTAAAATDHLARYAPATRELIVCGGGALNRYLMSRLAARLPGVSVIDSAQRGLPPLQVEAAAFAWLASACLSGRPGNLPEVTGARGPRILGAVHPA